MLQPIAPVGRGHIILMQQGGQVIGNVIIAVAGITAFPSYKKSIHNGAQRPCRRCFVGINKIRCHRNDLQVILQVRESETYPTLNTTYYKSMIHNDLTLVFRWFIGHKGWKLSYKNKKVGVF